MGALRHELCCNCGNETGKAGRADDSIYVQSYGPLCEKCYDDFRAEVLESNERPNNARDLSAARAALRDMVALGTTYIEEAGPCDHSVNICICDIIRRVEEARAILSPATPGKEE